MRYACRGLLRDPSLEKDLALKKLSLSLVLASLIGLLSLASSVVAQPNADRLALKGYDPVAYFTDKRPMLGDPQYQYEWDGAVYRFASAKHLDLFKESPDRYLPQYNNWCAASVAKGEGVWQSGMVARGRRPPVFVWKADRSWSDEQGSRGHEEPCRRELVKGLAVARTTDAGLHASHPEPQP